MSVTGATKANPETKDPLQNVLMPVTFKVKDKEFRASKDVLITSSAVFGKMFTNGMKETSSDVIPLNEEPETFQILMDYLHLKIPFIATSNVEALCYYADKYQIEILKVRCEEFLLKKESFSSQKERIRIANKFRYFKPFQQYVGDYLNEDWKFSLKDEFCKQSLLILVEYLFRRK
jgi:hypothetical protein